MKLPLGFHSNCPQKICRLHKSLMGYDKHYDNGLPNYLLNWRRMVMFRSYANYFVFTYRKEDMPSGVLVYVDNIILAGNDALAC